MTDDGFRLFPEAASAHASEVDALYFALVAMTAFFTFLIAGLIIYFGVKYRRGNTRVDRTGKYQKNIPLEIFWIAVPVTITVVIFVWGARLFLASYRVPVDAMEIHVVAKQWMWKFQHPDGRREINTLHVPRGRPVRLSMISEDVIHSLFLPALRMKQDVLPGRYESYWFNANRTGNYLLFCAEYCGTDHSSMTGQLIVLEPAEYEAWLAGGRKTESPIELGAQLMTSLRCNVCHLPATGEGRCPSLEKVYGHDVRLRDGSTVHADEDYIRESILRPQAKVVAGFEPIMPSFESQLTEEQVMQLVAYIKSLADARTAPQTPAPAPAPSEETSNSEIKSKANNNE